MQRAVSTLSCQQKLRAQYFFLPYYASVTFALRRLNDARTLSKSPFPLRPPQGDLAIIVRIYRHRGLYDFV